MANSQQRRRRPVFIICSVSAGLSAGAAAAQAINPTELAPAAAPPQSRGVRSAAPPAGAGLEAPRNADKTFVTVRRVAIDGAFGEMAEQNAALTGKLQGRRVSLAQIYEAAQELQEAYRKAYPFARVSIPSQNLQSGEIRVIVVDGYIEKLDLSGVPERSRELVRERVEPLIGQRHLTLGEYQRRTMMIGYLAGISGVASARPGTASDGNILEIRATENRVSAVMAIDNRLPSYFGPWQFSNSVALNNSLGFGEQISVSTASGPDFNRYFDGTAKSQAYVGDVNVPIGVDGLTVSAGYLSARSRPSPLPLLFSPLEEVAGQRSANRFDRAYVRVGYPLILTAAQSLKVGATYEFTDNQLLVGPSPAGFTPFRGWTFDVSHDRYGVVRFLSEGSSEIPWGWGGNASGLAVFSQGLGGRTDWGSPLLVPPLSRPGASPTFSKVAVRGVIRLNLPEAFQASLIARGQTSFGQPLMIAENFSLDGSMAVSGYAAGTLNVDRGVSLRTELSRPLAFELLGTQNIVAPYVFYAWGRGVHEWAFASEFKRVRAETVGLGFRADTNITGAPYGESLSLEFGKSTSNVPFREVAYRTNVAFNVRYAGNPLDPDLPGQSARVTKGPALSSDAPPIWLGFYAGLNAGYSWDPRPEAVTLGYPIESNLDAVLGLDAAAASALGASGISRASAGGFLGGGQIGYKYQLNRFVLGVEADIQGSSLRTRHGFSLLTPAAVHTAATAVENEKNVDWLGTLRGTVGYTITPTLLAYATGGLAYGGVTANTLVSQAWDWRPQAAGEFLQSSGSVGRFSDMRLGWTLGAGLEWMFSPNLSLKAEYLYYDLGTASYAASPLVTLDRPSSFFNMILPVTRTQFIGDVARIGLNYHFGKSEAAAPPTNTPAASLATGFYAGVNAGYTWDASPKVHTTGVPVLANLDNLIGANFTAASALSMSGVSAANADGAIAGGQVGYNYSTDKYLVGVETDLQGTSAKGRRGFAGVSPVTDPGGAGVGTVATAVDNEKSVDWLGTLRGRAGYAFTPSLLGYATGGLAYGQVAGQTLISQPTTTTLLIPQFSTNAIGRYTNIRTGWTVGGGVEWMFSPNVSLKAEYLYYDLGSVSYASTPLLGAFFLGSSFNVVVPMSRTRFDGQVARVGMNYHFDAFGPFVKGGAPN